MSDNDDIVTCECVFTVVSVGNVSSLVNVWTAVCCLDETKSGLLSRMLVLLHYNA